MGSVTAFSCRLLKGNRLLASYCLGAARTANRRHLLKINSFTLHKVPHTRGFSTSRLFPNSSKASNDSKVEPPDEKTEKIILEDDEIQNILQDFAKDFGVDEESSKILEDIKKNEAFPEGEETETCNNLSDATNNLKAYQTISSNKFQEFQDTDNTVIYDVHEEEKMEEEDDFFFHIDQEKKQVQTRMEAKRGVTGVYDIHELVAVLREENLYDIAVIRIPDHFHYVDYMVLVNAKSPRHLRAAALHIVKFYKTKKDENDRFVKIEGSGLDSWKAIDMGNIVLHILLEETRTCYDIESLWLLDSEYDTGGKGLEDEGETDILKEQMAFLKTIKLNEPENTEVENASETVGNHS